MITLSNFKWGFIRAKHQLSCGEPGLRLEPRGSLAFIRRQCLTIDSTFVFSLVFILSPDYTSDSNLNLTSLRFSRFVGVTSSKSRRLTVFRLFGDGAVGGGGGGAGRFFFNGVESDKKPESSLNASMSISFTIAHFSLSLAWRSKTAFTTA